MNASNTNIDDRTTVPLFAIIVGVPFVIGGIMWLTLIYASVAEATRVNVAQDLQLAKQMALIQETHDAVIRIESKLTR